MRPVDTVLLNVLLYETENFFFPHTLYEEKKVHTISDQQDSARSEIWLFELN